MYAIVKAGGRQEKVSVGETLVVDRIDAAVGSSVTFPAVLLVDGADVTADPKALSSVKVTGEILAEQKGPISTSSVTRARLDTVGVRDFVQN